MGLTMGLLVGGLEPRNFEWLSKSVGNFIIPTDELHHFSEGLNHQPNKNSYKLCWDNAGTFGWFLLDYDYYIPVVPPKAVAEVSE